MSSLNRVMLICRLCKDPESRFTQSGQQVVNLNVATNEKYKDKETVEWHKCICWGKLAELSEKYLKKGSLIYLEGKLQTRSYEKNGQKVYTTEIVAREIKFLDSNKKESSEPVQSQYEEPIPF